MFGKRSTPSFFKFNYLSSGKRKLVTLPLYHDIHKENKKI